MGKEERERRRRGDDGWSGTSEEAEGLESRTQMGRLISLGKEGTHLCLCNRREKGMAASSLRARSLLVVSVSLRFFFTIFFGV